MAYLCLAWVSWGRQIRVSTSLFNPAVEIRTASPESQESSRLSSLTRTSIIVLNWSGLAVGQARPAARICRQNIRTDYYFFASLSLPFLLLFPANWGGWEVALCLSDGPQLKRRPFSPDDRIEVNC